MKKARMKTSVTVGDIVEDVAKFMAHAVNCYEDLLRACEATNAACDELLIAIDQQHQTVEMAGSPDLEVLSDAVVAIQNQAKTAIAKAEGSEA